MSKSLFIMFVSCLFVFAFAWKAHSRPGERGIFEAPMVEVEGDCTPDTNGECDGSEGKVERNNDWKVEIEGVATEVCYDVCIESDPDNSALLCNCVSPDEDGEFKATESTYGCVSVPDDTYVNPRLVVREDDSDCNGDVYFTTGFSLD